MKYRRDPKVAPDRQKADPSRGPRTTVYIRHCALAGGVWKRQTPVRMV